MITASTPILDASAQATVPAANTGRGFPEGFLWGTATASYQIEGAVTEDGRGPSIWDVFSHTRGNTRDGATGDVADDHYHRYKSDIQLMKALGAKVYRFSVAWPRVFPSGVGTPNPKGLDFYDRLVDELLANGIDPYMTLYHWDLPQALQDRWGGWESRDTSRAFADYAGYVAAKLTDRVKHLFTLNELTVIVDLGYGSGVFAPGLKLPPEQLYQTRHNVLIGHGLGVQAIRAQAQAGTKVGIAENTAIAIPIIETPEDIAAARVAMREMNAGYLTAILEGRYTDAYLATAGANAPKFTSEDMKAISSPLDFVGINVYAPNAYVRSIDAAPGYLSIPFPASFPHMESKWLRIGPETLYWAPRHLAEIWGVKDIYITENGASAADVPADDGMVYDTDRIMYLRNYLANLQRATTEGVPVKGYFLWSLLDNFEWADGYNNRFGLYHVDYATQKRTAKLSASFYRAVMAANQVV